MSKFNLVNYQKISGDDHVERRLQDEHAVAPEKVTEQQLEKDRKPEKDMTLEKQLEKVRKCEEPKLTEKDLNETKEGLYKHRNAAAYSGDINKLEEQRLANDPVEDEKYEMASATPKKQRWWEKVNKEASTAKKETRTAQVAPLTFDKPHFEELSGQWGEEGVAPEESMGEKGIEDFDISETEEIDLNDYTNDMFLIRATQTEEPMATVFVSLGYDESDYESDAEIRTDALAMVTELRPELEGLISEEDFGAPSTKDGEGVINLRLTGEEYLSEGDPIQEDIFVEKSYDEIDVGGTPMVTGVVKINMDPDLVSDRDIIEFIESSHPGLSLSPDSLDKTRISEGEVKFAISGQTSEEVAEPSMADQLGLGHFASSKKK